MIEKERTVLFRIKKIDYQAIDFQPAEGNLLVGFNDTIKELKIDETRTILNFDIQRTVKFEPESLYELNVIYEIKVEYKETLENVVNEKEVIKNIEQLLKGSSVFSSLVTLIANITSAQGNPAVLTAPKLSLTGSTSE